MFKISKGKVKIYKGEPVLKEDTIHKYCIDWFYAEYGDFRHCNNSPLICHIANETPRSSNKIQMINYNRKMKFLGKIKGIPDFFIRKKTGEVIFVELKAIDCKIKDEQKQIFEYFNQQEEYCFVCKSLAEFQKVVKKFLH